MTPWPSRRALARLAVRCIGVVALAGCGGGDSAPIATSVIDTLPGNIPRVVSSAPADSGRWTLTLERTIQPAEGDSGELLAPQDLVLTSDGRVIVSESGSDAHLKLFDASGRFVRRFARVGEGPGEFRVAFLAERGDTLWVQDPQVGRLSLFRVDDGAYLASVPSACCYWSPIGFDAQGSVVLPAMGGGPDSLANRTRTFVRVNAALRVDTSVVFFPSAGEQAMWTVGDGDAVMMMLNVPLSPQPMVTVDAAGGFLVGWSGRYELLASGTGRDTTIAFGRPFTASPVSSGEKQALVEQLIARMTASSGGPSATTLRKSFNPEAIPNERPAYITVRTDAAGRTWVQRSLADTTVVEWDLFDRDRRWLDVLRIPTNGWSRDFGALSLGNERVAVVVEDEDGRPAVLVYTLTRRDP